MNLRNAGLIAFGFAIIPAVMAGFYVHRDLTTNSEMSLANRAGGKDRLDLLTKLTRVYVAHNTDAPVAMRKGAALAPEPFLNHELEAEGVKWRVRNIKGLAAETYNVT